MRRRPPVSRSLAARAAFAALAAAMLGAPAARADLQLCNRTSYVLDLALGLQSRGATATRGWFRVLPGDCRAVLAGDLDAERVFVASRALPAYGDAPQPPASTPLCVGGGDFVIAGADQCPAGGNHLMPFVEVKPSEDAAGSLVANVAEEEDYDALQARLAGIQRLLVAAGYDANPIDGLAGKKTDAAIAQFVRDRRLPADVPGKPAFFAALLQAQGRGESLGLTWCNDTRYAVMAALGTENRSGTVTTRGWYRLPSGRCTTPAAAGDAKRLYSFAEAVDDAGLPVAKGAATLAWGGSVILCTRDLKFEIDDQKDCGARGLRGTGFAPVDMRNATVRFRE